jgi:hypothetical protein
MSSKIEVGDTVRERSGKVLTVEHVVQLLHKIQLYFTDGTTGVYAKDGTYLLHDTDTPTPCRKYDIVARYRK